MTPGITDLLEKSNAKAPADKVTAALVTLMSRNEPGVVYDTVKASDLQDIPIMAG